MDVSPTVAPTTQAVGFLTIVQENNGYLGGYLVTNPWGRPLEFRLSTAVQPNRIQQILYGPTLQSYLCAELIGKTLVEKTAVATQCIFTDCEAALGLRFHIAAPIVWLQIDGSGQTAQPVEDRPWPLRSHQRFPDDVGRVRELLDSLDSGLDLAEPFLRIREAMSEARKLGVMNRN